MTTSLTLAKTLAMDLEKALARIEELEVRLARLEQRKDSAQQTYGHPPSFVPFMPMVSPTWTPPNPIGPYEYRKPEPTAAAPSTPSPYVTSVGGSIKGEGLGVRGKRLCKVVYEDGQIKSSEPITPHNYPLPEWGGAY